MSTNSIPRFETVHDLQGHGRGVSLVKISPDANDGSVIVWDLETGRSLQTFTLAASEGISAAVWCSIDRREPTEAFAIGEAMGKVTVYRKPKASNYDYASAIEPFTGPIECLAYDPRHRRLAMAGDGCLKIFGMDGTYSLSFIHGTVPRQQVARSTGFYADGACVFIGYLESKHMTGYRISPWAVQFDGDLETRIGYAAHHDGGDLFVTNLATGMDIYSFPPNTLPRRNVRFHIDTNYPLTLAVATIGEFVVIGGEDGHAQLYNTRIGVIDGMLPHGSHDSLIQHVDRIVIVTGCADDDNGSLKVWIPVARHEVSLDRLSHTQAHQANTFTSWTQWATRSSVLVASVYLATHILYRLLVPLMLAWLFRNCEGCSPPCWRGGAGDTTPSHLAEISPHPVVFSAPQLFDVSETSLEVSDVVAFISTYDSVES
ncbi:WD40 repeat-like protein [Coprinellus micaceus]|uniref:WD40 repeat-like protein n=1 Tax=Coprinellus micaceus TaxID=71717 RepID=A0A4Y7TWP1_COPMI|nr:WD40 repeat-like protein [Coprinellus micaceus]